jgi:hypothetical protein
MKILVAATLFVSQVAFAATTIHSTGKGETQDEAVRRAKISAVETTTGSFNLGHRSVRGDRYNEEIDDYVSGVIIESEVLTSEKKDGLWHVKIRAVVDDSKQGTFEVQRDKPLFNERTQNKIAEMNNRKEVMDKLDSNGQMLYLADQRVDVRPHHDVTVVTISGRVKWQQKWVQDFEKFVLYAGNMNTAKKTYQSNVYLPVSFSNPIFVVGNILSNPSESETRPGYAYCFVEAGSRLDQQRCANLGYEMRNFPKFNTIKTTIVFKDTEGRVIHNLNYTKFDIKVADFASAGTTKKDNFLFFSASHYFKTNTSIVMTDASVPVTFDFTVRNELVPKIGSYSVVIN